MAGKRGATKQPSIINRLGVIAETHGYKITKRKKDQKAPPEEKKFLPDLITTSFVGNHKRVFEVEATVTNNTIYKSLFSLLTALKGGAEQAYLIVPDKHFAFTQNCLKNLTGVIRFYSKKAMGAHPKIKLGILSFSDIEKHYQKAVKYENTGRIGQPPKCLFLPR